ncbi:MAG: class I SAM-dependent methyltransferase [Candidatus Omnitrophica bacterium]|nr:class I SAM-dependent methyltransferase [Candidatus Omnitrophota bacterium]
MTAPAPRWQRVAGKLRRAILRDSPTYYDMYENAGERYFAKLYLHQIAETIGAHGPGHPLRILDAGCQTGRLAIPLAVAGHDLTGVDTSDLALRRARRHAKAAGVSLRCVRADLSRWLPAHPPEVFDAVVCTEVLYQRPNYRALLEHLIRILKPGGLLFISHRPTGYYLLEAFRQRDWGGVRRLLSSSEGTVNGSYYNWQDRADLTALYGTLPVDLIAITPIGFFSWMGVNPDHLDAEGQELLFRTEIASHDRCGGSGRYLLVSGRKRTA